MMKKLDVLLPFLPLVVGLIGALLIASVGLMLVGCEGSNAMNVDHQEQAIGEPWTRELEPQEVPANSSLEFECTEADARHWHWFATDPELPAVGAIDGVPVEDWSDPVQNYVVGGVPMVVTVTNPTNDPIVVTVFCRLEIGLNQPTL